MNKEAITNPFESLHDTIVFDSKDWGKYEKDAWIYGIVVGWDNTPGIYNEFKEKFKWTKETFERLQTLHQLFMHYKKISGLE